MDADKTNTHARSGPVTGPKKENPPKRGRTREGPTGLSSKKRRKADTGDTGAVGKRNEHDDRGDTTRVGDCPLVSTGAAGEDIYKEPPQPKRQRARKGKKEGRGDKGSIHSKRESVDGDKGRTRAKRAKAVKGKKPTKAVPVLSTTPVLPVGLPNFVEFGKNSTCASQWDSDDYGDVRRAMAKELNRRGVSMDLGEEINDSTSVADMGGLIQRLATAGPLGRYSSVGAQPVDISDRPEVEMLDREWEEGMLVSPTGQQRACVNKGTQLGCYASELSCDNTVQTGAFLREFYSRKDMLKVHQAKAYPKERRRCLLCLRRFIADTVLKVRMSGEGMSTDVSVSPICNQTGVGEYSADVMLVSSRKLWDGLSHPVVLLNKQHYQIVRLAFDGYRVVQLMPVPSVGAVPPFFFSLDESPLPQAAKGPRGKTPTYLER